MPPKLSVVEAPPRYLYECDVCGKESKWTDDHMFWGSLASEEAGEYIVVCSETCRKKVKNPSALFRKVFGHGCTMEHYGHPYGRY